MLRPVTSVRYADPQSTGPGCRCCWGHRLLVPPFWLVGQQYGRIRAGAARNNLSLGCSLADVRLFLVFEL